MGGLIKKIKNIFGERRGLIDYSLLFIVLFLLGFGLVMLYSTSSYDALVNHGKSTYFLEKQMLYTSFGLVLMAVVSKIPYTFWKKISCFLFASSSLNAMRFMESARTSSSIS